MRSIFCLAKKQVPACLCPKTFIAPFCVFSKLTMMFAGYELDRLQDAEAANCLMLR